MTTVSDELSEIINQRIEALRPRLLDLSRNNPLISTKLSARSNSHVRAVDELPDVLFYNLCNGQEMRFAPLPGLDDDPADEQAEQFQRALANARLTDPDYLAAAEALDVNAEDYPDLSRKIDRSLRDKVRAQIGFPPRPSKQDINLLQHAKNNGIAPSYDLPLLNGRGDNPRHLDSDVQTLQLPKDLERKLSALHSKCNTWIQETGINVLHGAFGLLEWTESNATDSSFAPLVLLQVRFHKRKTKDGFEFWVSGLGEEPEINLVMAEKLRLEFGVQLPPFEKGSVETYFSSVSQLAPKNLKLRVRRQVVFGVFPSARIAMYRDLDTQTSNFPENQIIRPLFGGNGSSGASPFADEYLVDEPEIERKVPFLVLDADSSQFSTLVDVANGKNVAVEGPPGTGKSQTIVNTIAAAMAQGKRVLFVAEKMAALDVVRSRLEAIGLGEFLLPLQAERSTRENVIKSVRERLELKPTRPPPFFEEQLKQFRATRDETALYINTASQLFADTGLTVHEILGKSITTADYLSGLPKTMQLGQFPLRDGLTLAAIKRLAEKGDILANAWANASGAPPFWKGMARAVLNRFDIEEVTDLAEDLAGKLESLIEQLNALRALGIDGVKLRDKFPSLQEAFRTIDALKQPGHRQLAARLSDAATHKSFGEFLDACRSTRQMEERFRHIFAQPVSTDTIAALEEMESVCAEHKLESVEFGLLAESLRSKRQAIRMANRLADQMRPFARHVPGSEHWRFSDVEKIRNLVAAAGEDVLAARSDGMVEPAAVSILKQVNAQGRMLAVQRDELATQFSLAIIGSLEQLVDCLNALKGGRGWRLLSPGYRRAKNHYSRLAKAKYQREEAIVALERLIEWKTAETSFASDARARSLYGLHFRSLDTDFLFFERIVEFYDNARAAFPGLEQKPIREFVFFADCETVVQVPALDAYPETIRLKVLEEGIPSLEAEASSRERACERLRILSDVLITSNCRVDTLPTLRHAVTSYLAAKQRLDNRTDIRALLGAAFKGAETHSHDFDDALLAGGLLQSLGLYVKIAVNIVVRGESGGAATLIHNALDAFAACDRLAEELDKKAGLPANSPMKRGSLTERAQALHLAALDKTGLLAHTEFARVRAELDSRTSDLVESYFKLRESYQGLGNVLEAMSYRSLARRVYEAHGSILSKYSGSKLNELRKKLARTDKLIIESSRQMLKAKVQTAAKPPQGIGVGRKSSWTELALVENEASKKQRYIPVRELTRRAARALQELKPCWMMSPLAVAQYLEKGLLSFDLCIIDEASQMPPENSVGALARSRQAMIVGDTNQLPPSNFFRKMLDDDELDDDQAVLNESILEMANAIFRPARRLRWHYRSRHSGLIKFSNRLVYDDDLVVFPSAMENLAGMGVELRSVDGLYKAGTNAIEAQVMVEAAIRFMHKNPNRSLGVVALNQKQRDLIFEEMDYALSHDIKAARYVEDWAQRNDGLEHFFIKNLENVQGDERDVIFIGTVYGPEQPGGRVMNRFGPINGLAGKRRLNVLFSRAKQLIITFSSMKSADILAEEDGNEGAYMLKRWLEYAATGVLESGEKTSREPDSDFEVYVMQQIQAIGCTPVPQVGVKGYSIDIGVKHPQWPHGFILGVECDGASFHSSKSARDRDRLRQEVLEGLGWRFHRIWSTDWFNDPGKQVEILRSVIAERMRELKAKEREFVKEPSKPTTEARPTAEAITRPARPAPQPDAMIAPAASSGRVSVGDTVRVRYLTDDKKTVQFTISAERSDPDNGVIHFKRPLAEALLGAEEGEEVEILVGSYLRQAVLEKIVNRLH